MHTPFESNLPPQAVRLVRLSLGYNGESFHGWQSQPDGTGIQDAVEAALATVLREKVRLTSSSRTDTGVHAEHQVATFRTHSAIEPYRLVRGLNALLPSAVRIRDAADATLSFHPIHSAKGKIYRYRIWRAAGITPFVAPYVWHLTNPLAIDAMVVAATAFVGTHDFTSFCASDSSAVSKVRRILDVRIVSAGPLIEMWFCGEGFLKQMVRNIVGTLVAVGQGKVAADAVADLLATRDRRATPATAPALGLCLVQVCYENAPNLDALLGTPLKGYNLPLDGEWHGL